MIAWLLGMGALFGYVVLGLRCLDRRDASRATTLTQPPLSEQDREELKLLGGAFWAFIWGYHECHKRRAAVAALDAAGVERPEWAADFRSDFRPGLLASKPQALGAALRDLAERGEGR